MLQTALDDTAAICVDAERVDLVGESAKDEVNILGFATFDSFLNDMVAILVLDASYDVVFEFSNKCSLLIIEDVIEGLCE